MFATTGRAVDYSGWSDGWTILESPTDAVSVDIVSADASATTDPALYA